MKNTLLLTLITLVASISFYSCKKNEDNPTNTSSTKSTFVLNNFMTKVKENPRKNQSLGKIQLTTNQPNKSFSLISQIPNGALNIDTNSGEIFVKDSTLFDYETRKKITGKAEVKAGSMKDTTEITISILDVDESGGSSPTIWKGAKTTFTKADKADPTQPANQDRLTANVWITRGNSGGQIYNIKTETSASKSSSPAGTEWSLGTTANLSSLTFKDFRTAVGKPKNVVGKNLVLHLITDDIYLDIKFTSWSPQKAGGFAYERTTP